MADPYVSIASIRAEGITVTELSDVRATSLILGWQAWFERMTGQFFTPKDATLDFDGDGSRLLQLPVPLITCDALYINDNFTSAIDSSQYVLYNRRGPIQDDRNNPRIKLKRTSSNSIFSAGSSSVFEVGDMNIRVDGTWGYVESDDSTPLLVSRAVMILVITTKELLGDDDIDQLKVGRVVEEVTDRHRIEYSDLYDRLHTWGATGITEVDQAIQIYRSPISVNAPRNMGLFV